MVQFDDRETATVLAALRYWQREGWRSCGHEVDEIATDGGRFEALDPPEIDALCERINMGEDAPAPAGIQRVRKVCGECGSSDVLADAWAVWDEDTQRWQIADVMDGGHSCESCGGECSIVETAIEPGT